MSITFALTDPHGCLDLLVDLVGKCESFACGSSVVDPLYVFLGDYVDKGPDSAGVVKYIRAMQDTHRVIALKGNHDNMMARCILGDYDPDWVYNGIRRTAQSYGFNHPYEDQYMIEAMTSDPQVVSDAEWLDALPLYWEDDLRIFVHAGIRPGISMDKQDPFDLMWIRNEFHYYPSNTPKHVVHGHTPSLAVNYSPYNRTNLDTGGFARGTLTAGIFNTEIAGPIGYLRSDRDNLKANFE